jgi:hypothetical protein
MLLYRSGDVVPARKAHRATETIQSIWLQAMNREWR